MIIISNITEQKYQKIVDKNSLIEAFTKDEAILLPDDAKWGDVIRALFPTFEVKDLDPVILEQNYPKPFCKMQFDKKFWDAPYKKRGDKDE